MADQRHRSNGGRGQAPSRAHDGEFSPPTTRPPGSAPLAIDGPVPAASGAACPACGVAVAPGYPKCPKCHAGLPVMPSPLERATTARPTSVGGTSVTSESSQTWLLAGLAGIVVFGIVVYLATRSEPGDAGVPLVVAPAEAVEPPAVAVGGQPVEEPFDAEVEFGDAVAEAGGDPEALTDVRARLQVAKLWSTVFVDPEDSEVVMLESDQCEDQAMMPLVDEMRGFLTEAGFGKVVCLSKFGATVFEREWRQPSGPGAETAADEQ